jgi:membrane protein YqaA with SNARE-associated domain
MNDFEAYWLLFTDTLVANIFFTFKGEMINKTMYILGKYNNKYIALISALASTIAAMINYIFGIAFYNIYKSSTDPILKHNYGNMEKLFKGYKILFLIFNIIPILGKFLMMIAGFLRLSISKVFVIIFASRLIYYLYNF